MNDRVVLKKVVFKDGETNKALVGYIEEVDGYIIIKTTRGTTAKINKQYVVYIVDYVGGS